VGSWVQGVVIELRPWLHPHEKPRPFPLSLRSGYRQLLSDRVAGYPRACRPVPLLWSRPHHLVKASGLRTDIVQGYDCRCMRWTAGLKSSPTRTWEESRCRGKPPQHPRRGYGYRGGRVGGWRGTFPSFSNRPPPNGRDTFASSGSLVICC